jgi:hypothetical protein
MEALVMQGVNVLWGKIDLDHRGGRVDGVVLLELSQPVSLRDPASQDNPQSLAA